ncbi:MAG: dinitrogenase iron-molybdenum cofactor biosynthesis protein [Planctomycetota bacterium]|nr:MAG: dinitrogenase iron-molybdenum cofactor biosynthesis protein [Planctomycetota bacterium]
MKIAITSQGQALDSQVDSRFGRARFFIVVDTETGEFSASDNGQNLNAAQGAGIQAGKNVVDLGVEAVVTGHVGPKAFATLQAGGVKVYTGAAGPAGAEADSAETLTVAEAIEQFKAGQLKQTNDADVEGHWVV